MMPDPRALRTLTAVVETLTGDAAAAPRIARRMADLAATLPHREQRFQFALLVRLLGNPLVNLFMCGRPRPFDRLPLPVRERYLSRWAASWLAPLRQAFQAFKRLATVLYYSDPDHTGRNPTWSRIGYPGPLGPAPDKPRSITPMSITQDTALDCDVVVVGSGAGGAVVAARLAEAGTDVVVLEAGDYVSERDFSHREVESLDRLYWHGGRVATDDLGLMLLAGSCLGGGTVVNYTTSFHTPEAVRRQWARERGLPHFEGREYADALDRAAQRIGVSTKENAPGGRDRVLRRGLEALGWHHGLLPRDVRGCSQDAECGYCGLGCRRSAKQSTLVTYLVDAAGHGARILVRCKAQRVRLEAGRAAGIEATADGRYNVTVRSRLVVVACGSIESPALLLRSGISSPSLGRHLALHPATAVFGFMPERVDPWTGSLQTVYSDQFADLDSGYGFKFETAPAHPAFAALALPWEGAAAHGALMTRLPHLTLVGILLRDRDGGRVTVNRDGQPVVRYRLSPYDRAHLRRGLIEAARVLQAAGASEILSPHPSQVPLFTFHQMASCRMGGSRAESVVDPEHRVWGVEGLYVADASCFPSSSGVNPMLTIMGMAERGAGVLLSRL
jgi:choline dehydrogenase-like flavoprotein